MFYCTRHKIQKQGVQIFFDCRRDRTRASVVVGQLQVLHQILASFCQLYQSGGRERLRSLGGRLIPFVIIVVVIIYKKNEKEEALDIQLERIERLQADV